MAFTGAITARTQDDRMPKYVPRGVDAPPRVRGGDVPGARASSPIGRFSRVSPIGYSDRRRTTCCRHGSLAGSPTPSPMG